MVRAFALALGCALLAGALPARAAPTEGAPGAAEAADPFQWLEDVHGARAMDWVKAENSKSLKVLEGDPRFASLHAAALAIAEAPDRIPAPEFLGGQIYNFWQDAQHVRGLWRRTSLEGYAQQSPPWSPVLDVDALAGAEGANWVFKGADCEWRGQRLCMISLSDGGEDAVTVREFDVAGPGFVEGGFNLPKGKQRLAWADPDTLLVSREWTPGELTASGYPYVVKALKRGRPLAEAVEVYRGAASDGGYGVSPQTFHDGDGRQALVISRPLSTFEDEKWLVTPAGPRKLSLPLKSAIQDLVAGRLLVTLDEAWTVGGQAFPHPEVRRLP
jgi:prolyl oligopeptidase